MIFAQYKHAITFALAIMALAVVVADPGGDDAGDPAAPVAAVAQPAPQGRPVPVAATVEPEWYGATADAAEPAVTPEDEATVDNAGYDVAPALAANTARTSRPAAAPTPAAQAGTYVAPPPPPQNFQP